MTYTWGLDLSGTDQGAGGVGGLLMIHDSSTHFVAMDGNGNVAALTDGTDVTGQYEYDPFGNLLRVTGSAGVENPFRFSTKYWDEETGLVYYGYRYYSPIIGRWINRDPIEEDGGLNLYGMTNNNPINLFDFLGHKTKKTYEIKFVGAGRIDPWGAYKFGNVTEDSRAHKEALNDVIDYFDCDYDRLLTKNDFPPFRIKILGYSWGGWSALELTHNLATIVSNTSDLRVAIGTLDPVATLRGFGLGKQTLPSYVVKAWNVYQRNGNRSALGNLLGFPFKGFAVKGALGAGPGGKENVSKLLLPHFRTGKLQLVDHISIQEHFRGNLWLYSELSG